MNVAGREDQKCSMHVLTIFQWQISRYIVQDMNILWTNVQYIVNWFYDRIFYI